MRQQRDQCCAAENPIKKAEFIEQTQQEALDILKHVGISDYSAECLWASLNDDYFLREEAQDIAWHTEAIIHHSADQDNADKPLVLVKETSHLRRRHPDLYLYPRP